MTKKEITAVVKKYTDTAKETSSDEMRTMLAEENFLPEDVDKIIEGLYPDKKGNAALDLSEFDYHNLTGEKFKKYVEIAGDRNYRTFDPETNEEKPVVGQLKENDMYDFVCHKVEVVMKTRYAGVPNSPHDFNGIKIKNERPEHTTRMPVKTAHELNAQILNAHSRAGYGKYYLLKKVKS